MWLYFLSREGILSIIKTQVEYQVVPISGILYLWVIHKWKCVKVDCLGFVWMDFILFFELYFKSIFPQKYANNLESYHPSTVVILKFYERRGFCSTVVLPY